MPKKADDVSCTYEQSEYDDWCHHHFLCVTSCGDSSRIFGGGLVGQLNPNEILQYLDLMTDKKLSDLEATILCFL